MKKLSILLIAVLLLTLVSCGGDYIDTVSSSELATTAIAYVTTEGGTRVLDDDVILEFVEDDVPSYLRDYTVIKANNAKNINEFGIFRVEDGKASDMKEIVESYVSNLKGQYRSMQYFPEEVEKIDFATVKAYGNYVVYSFLNESDTEAFYTAIENNLKK